MHLEFLQQVCFLLRLELGVVKDVDDGIHAVQKALYLWVQ
jgi:hypothetical protein